MRRCIIRGCFMNPRHVIALFLFFNVQFTLLKSQNNEEYSFCLSDDRSQSNGSIVHIESGSEISGILACLLWFKEIGFGESESQKTRRLEKEKQDRLREEERARRLARIEFWTYSDFLENYFFTDPVLIKEFSEKFERDPLFCQIHFYRYSGFRDLLARHPNYVTYIKQIQQKLKKDTQFIVAYGYKSGEFEELIGKIINNIEAQKRAAETERIRQQQIIAQMQEQERTARIKQQQQNEYRESVIKVMQDADSKIVAYQEIYQEIDCNKLSNVEARRVQIIQKRKDALSRFNLKCDQWQEESYKFLDKAQKLLNEQSMKIADYVTCFGNTIQRVLHQEMVTIIHDTAEMRYVNDDYSRDRESVATTIMRFIQTGHLYNREGQIGKTFSCVDFCWGLLDCQVYIFNTLVQTSVDISHVAIAATKGVVRGGLNVVFKMGQPIRTFSDFADEVAYLIALTGEHLQYAHEERKKTFQRMRAQIDLDEYNLSIGAVTQADLMQRDFNYFKSDCNQTVMEAEALLNYTWQSLNRENVLYGVEKVSEIGTEMFLTSKATHAVSTFFKNGSIALDGIIEAGDGAKKFYDLPFNSNTLEAYIGYEAAIADIRAASVAATKKAAAKAAHVLNKASKVTPIMAMSNGGPGGSGPNNPVSGVGNIPNPPMDIVQAVSAMPNNLLAYMENTFDGKLISNGQPVKFAYRHLWEAHVAKNGIDLSGFHHDYMGTYRKQGLIRNIRMHADGFYKAEVLFKGKWVEKSFFPEHWTHDQVMQSIFQAFNNPVSDMVKNGCRVLEGKLSSGVIIRNVLVNATGKGITVYPLL